MSPLSHLRIPELKAEAAAFADAESNHDEPRLFGVTDGKAIGTYVEEKFKTNLDMRYNFDGGNAALGVDLPGLEVDIKVTSIKQPQSSSPFKSARQKIYGLGHSLLVFVYDKTDNATTRTARLSILHTVFIEPAQTADYQITHAILDIIKRNGNEDDLVALMRDRNLPLDYDIEGYNLARELLQKPPAQGYLTISNALQWRLQYGRAIDLAGKVNGVYRVR